MKLIKHLNAIGLCLAALTPLATAQVPSLDARVDIDIVERDLSEVVQYLREKSGANLVILAGGTRRSRRSSCRTCIGVTPWTTPRSLRGAW